MKYFDRVKPAENQFLFGAYIFYSANRDLFFDENRYPLILYISFLYYIRYILQGYKRRFINFMYKLC